jgi:hypothetical protein
MCVHIHVCEHVPGMYHVYMCMYVCRVCYVYIFDMYVCMYVHMCGHIHNVRTYVVCEAFHVPGMSEQDIFFPVTYTYLFVCTCTGTRCKTLLYFASLVGQPSF